MNFSMISQYQTVIKPEDVEAKSMQTENEKLFEKTFNDKDSDEVLKTTPNKEIIQNYTKNIIITSKMEKEAPIIALVYIERLILSSGLGITNKNWRKIILIALIIANKIWDDESFENENFA